MKVLLRWQTTLMAVIFLAGLSVQDYNGMGYNLKSLLGKQDFPNSVVSNYDGSVSEEYIRHVHSMINAYRGGGGAAGTRYVIETNALVDTKYRAWKRNGDLINSLLGLPKGMNDAGR